MSDLREKSDWCPLVRDRCEGERCMFHTYSRSSSTQCAFDDAISGLAVIANRVLEYEYADVNNPVLDMPAFRVHVIGQGGVKHECASCGIEFSEEDHGWTCMETMAGHEWCCSEKCSAAKRDT